MLTKLRLNKFDVLALLEKIPCDYDSEINVDKDFDKDSHHIKNRSTFMCTR